MLYIFAGLSALAGSAAWYYTGNCWLLPAAFVGTFLGFLLLAFLVVVISCALVDMEKPQTKDSAYFRKLIKLYLKPGFQLLKVRLKTEGAEKVPTHGRFLLVCNHLNEMDPVCLVRAFPDSQLAFISKRENTTMFIIGKLMHALMCQLINRENDREALKTIIRCIQLLKEDMVSIAVFPEGYITTTGKLQRFRAGVFKIALKAQVPIVVCTLQGTEDVFHNALRRKSTEVKLHVIETIPYEEIRGKTAVAISDYCYHLMLNDLDAKYVPAENAGIPEA